VATYYVDLDNGDDANAGTSTAAPWKFAPDMQGVTGTAASTSILAADTLYINGSVVFGSSGTNAWPIATHYGNGVTIKPWPGVSSFIVDGNQAWDRTVSITRRVNITGMIAKGSKGDVATSCGVRLGTGTSNSILRQCEANDNGRFGFYANSVGAGAGIQFIDCVATRNDTQPSDNSGSGRYAAGFHIEGSGSCILLRCRANRNGNSTNVSGDGDGRGISIVSTSPGCAVIQCEALENGDYTGAISAAYNGSGVEGSASVGCSAIGCILMAQGAGIEAKEGCNNWIIAGNFIEALGFGALQVGYFNGTNSTGAVIANNTISGGSIEFATCLALSSGSNTAVNNIFLQNRSDWPPVSIRNSAEDIDADTISLDYNCDYGNTNNLHVAFQNTSINTQYSSAAWTALHASHDSNSLIDTDPGITGDYRIGTGSPCYQAGVYVPGARDLSGRKLRNPPDIGAHQYQASRTTTTRTADEARTLITTARTVKEVSGVTV